MGENWLVNIGTKPGLFIYRIDNKSQQLSRVAYSDYGTFRSDDCYICLDTKIDHSNDENNLHSIFIWQGKTTEQQEYTDSKVAELEGVLGDISISKETQEHESDLFLSFFKTGVRYVEPIELSMQKNLRDGEFPTKLYHLKGRRNVRVNLVEITFESLNSGDVFILDANEVIYQWNGKTASRMEKAKALDLTVRLRDERMNRLKAEIVIIEEGRETDEFWNELGGQGPIAGDDEGGDDAEFESVSRLIEEQLLYQVQFDGDELSVNLVDTEGKPHHRHHLLTEFCYILDCQTELWVWTGKKSPLKLKKAALAHANEVFKTQEGRPTWTPVTKVSESAELALFKARFRGSFTEYIDTPEAYQARIKQSNVVADKERQAAINIDALHHPEKYAIAREELHEYVPNASQADGYAETELNIWFIEGSEKHPLSQEDYGIFYSEMCYIVQYTVRLRSGGKRHVIYYWQGRTSNTDEKGTSALLASDLQSSLGNGGTIVRVVQNKEPDHFLSHFQGYFTVRKGNQSSWEEVNEGMPRLFIIRGESAVNTTAVQVEAAAFSLNSNDCFVLHTSDSVFVWHGKGANQFERETALIMVNRTLEDAVGNNVTEIEEEQEPDEFWDALGGKGEYDHSERLIEGDISARLFQCSDNTGVFKVFQIHNFVQDDLDDDDVMLLDTFKEVFVWIGNNATKQEKEMGKHTAQEYIRLADDGRDPDSPIYLVEPGCEPLQFTVYFQGWDESIAQSREDIYSRRLRQLQLEDSVVGGHEKGGSRIRDRAESARRPTQTPRGAIDTNGLVVDYDRLIVKPLPDGVDGAHLEAYLSDEQFLEFVKMTPGEFYKLPKWKAIRVKKETGLF
eukprot:TRINITY_DN8927_c0_g1_i1.p1 TRINITY_DN8927_c0_g1~~TRINITY_DN8927_c0_g1_i1.p1  ORF type:complete len:849 (-),score=234.30 TRINITY_DN8927_c0_g1_i1:52-2598(-)